jgi:hypothetical protein
VVIINILAFLLFWGIKFFKGSVQR